MTSNASAMLIVGAGHAGGRAALALRANGWTGPVVLIGDEADPPYERPPLSKGMLSGETFGAWVADAGRLAEAGIEWRSGRRALTVDREHAEVRLDDGSRIAYRSLLLATGGSPRRLPLPGMDRPGVQMLRNLDDARGLAPRLRSGARIVVIGGGFIGLEAAASARGRGCEVVVIEALPRLLGRAVPATIAAEVAKVHAANGVTIRTGVAPSAIEGGNPAASPDGLRVRCADGSSHSADAVVVGIGIVPNTALAEGSGLACDNGIAVDAGLRSADPSIFAAGDVAAVADPQSGRRRRLESWDNAEDHARVAAANMLGGQETVGRNPWFWSDQYDHQLQIGGELAAAATVATRPLGDSALLEFHLAADGRLTGFAGWGPTALVARELKLARTLLERGRNPPAAALSDPAVRLKSLL